jgi:hypothetical protein
MLTVVQISITLAIHGVIQYIMKVIISPDFSRNNEVSIAIGNGAVHIVNSKGQCIEVTWDCGFYNYGNNTELYGDLKLTVKYEGSDEVTLLGCLDDSVEMWDTRALTNMIGSGVVPFVFKDDAIKALLICIGVLHELMVAHFKLHIFSPEDTFVHALHVQLNFGNDSPQLLVLNHQFSTQVGTKLAGYHRNETDILNEPKLERFGLTEWAIVDPIPDQHNLNIPLAVHELIPKEKFNLISPETLSDMTVIGLDYAKYVSGTEIKQIRCEQRKIYLLDYDAMASNCELGYIIDNDSRLYYY